jgi:glyoxylase-like metal-dependent hydrolase (beta-lactamase superfamily II)
MLNRRTAHYLAKGNSMTDNWYDALPRSGYSNFKKTSISEDWFEVYEIAANLFVFYEPRHCEEAISNLVIGQEKAALIDTGCGIGNLRKAVEEVTDKPVMVINTHTHTDHLGSNHQFDEIAMFDHPLSHRVAEKGVSYQTMHAEILEESLVIKPWPPGFHPNGFSLPPFKVSRWLTDGDRIDLGDRDLEVIYTPGEAVDHICLLDRADRILFCGDILVHGSVWTHLEGGNLKELLTSYRRLMGYFNDFDRLLPSHNEPWLDKDLLPESLAGAEKVVSGLAEYREIIDSWNRQLRQYPFGRFDILTRQ